MASKTVSVAVAAVVVVVVVTIAVGVAVAASLGLQDDVLGATDPQLIPAPSETPDTVDETSVAPAEPQDSASQTTEPPVSPASSEEFETVDVGIMFPSAGAQASHGHDSGVAARLGASDFNAYLEEIGASWRMNLIFADTQFNSTTDTEKIRSLDSKGVKFVLGPETSAQIHSIRSYVDSNGMVLISPSSTSPSLAIDDSIFRLTSNSAQQGRALALLFEQEGIEAVVPIYRADAWGKDIHRSVKNSFEALGGVMDEGIAYRTTTYDNLTFHDHYTDYNRYTFNPAALSGLVNEYIGQYSAEKVAVLVIGFSETAYLLDRTGSFESLHSVRWFGSESLSRDSAFLDHPKASAFAQDVNFVSVRFAPSTNDVYEHVRDYFADFEGLTPGVSAFASYDSVWVLGKAILEVGSADSLAVRNSITDAASTHTGAIGTIHLNEFGDFAAPSYDLWHINDDAWYRSGHFDAENSTFDLASDLVMYRDPARSDLPEVIDVGLMVPYNNDLILIDEIYLARLGLADLNSYLEEIGASWRMNFVLANTLGGHSIETLYQIQLLDSKGIKFVLGPASSAEVHRIKFYADSNDMVLISPTSGSPSLAVTDNIFRFYPDDNRQGNVLSLLFGQEGIEAVIPVYRGDARGDGIYESAKNSFEALGGVMDEGIRYSPEAGLIHCFDVCRKAADYSPEATAYYAEAALLSDLVDEYTGQYSAEKVAVLMIGFSETVHLLDSASSFDNLHNVRWFGSDGSSHDPTLSDDPTVSAFLQDVDFASTLFDTSRNDVYAHVNERFVESNGRTSYAYYFASYDNVWVLGKAILEADSVDPLIVRDAITGVAAAHTGTIGTINLNEFGDFATPSYSLWGIRDGQWHLSGHFDADNGTFSFT